MTEKENYARNDLFARMGEIKEEHKEITEILYMIQEALKLHTELLDSMQRQIDLMNNQKGE